MSISDKIRKTTDLDRGVELHQLGRLFGTDETNGHTFQITVIDQGEPVDLTGASLVGYFVKSDDVTVTIDGTNVSASGNVATVSLPTNCYTVTGRFTFLIRATLNGVIHAIYYATGYVVRSYTDQIDSTVTVRTLDELEARINALEGRVATVVASIPPDYDTLNKSLEKITGNANVDGWATGYVSCPYNPPNNQIELTRTTSGSGAANFLSIIYPCEEDEKFIVTMGGGTGAARPWAFLGAPDTSNMCQVLAKYEGGSSYTCEDVTITAPTGAAYLIVNTHAASPHMVVKASPYLKDAVVRHDEQALNDGQKTQARTNIGAAAAADLTTLANGAVRHDIAQTLDGTQARTNIGAAAAADVTALAGGVVRHDTVQSLTAAQQAQARANIASEDVYDVSSEVVRYCYSEFPQTLSGAWRAAGTLNPGSEAVPYYHTPLLPVREGDTLYIALNMTTLWSGIVGAFFDRHGGFLEPVRAANVTEYVLPSADHRNQYDNRIQYLYTFTVPAGACYFSRNISPSTSSERGYLMAVSNFPVFVRAYETPDTIIRKGDPNYEQHKNDHIMFIGPSTVFLDKWNPNYAGETIESTTPSIVYPAFAQNIVGFQEYIAPWVAEIKSYGVSGGSWKSGTSLSIYDRFMASYSQSGLQDYDTFVIMASMNMTDDPNDDFTYTQTNTTTYYGAIKGVCDLILTRRPDARIVIATGPSRASYWYTPTRRTRSDAIYENGKLFANLYGYDYLDLQDGSGFNAKSCRRLMYDGVHYNQEGSRRLGLLMRKALIGK